MSSIGSRTSHDAANVDVGTHPAFDRLPRSPDAPATGPLRGATPALFSHDLSDVPIHLPARPAGPTDADGPLSVTRWTGPSAAAHLPPVTGCPGDGYEIEADRVAARVLRMRRPPAGRLHDRGSAPTAVQTAGEPGPGDLLAAPLRSSGTVGALVRASATDTLATPGRALTDEARATFEPGFGRDLSAIRIHAGSRAEASARSIGARAYTVGRHIVLRRAEDAHGTGSARHVLAHEIVHALQQVSVSSPQVVQCLPEVPLVAYVMVRLDQTLRRLVGGGVEDYVTYRDAIARATPVEKPFALGDRELLTAMLNVLGPLSYARLAELLGMRAPTFDELRRNPTVLSELEAAWRASDVGVRDAVAEHHEEGGWVFMDLIDGALSIQRAKPEGTDFIRLEPPPDAPGSIVVALFHTHPDLGAPAFPSGPDRTQDARRGVPNLVIGNKGTNPKVFEIRLSGPAQRAHLASETKIPGPSGGVRP